MPNSSRPSLGSRATSDMAPLVNSRPNIVKGELARGTHAVQAGTRVTSGKRTALGGVAPFSPFLPLPPAPTAEELRLQCTMGSVQDTRSPIERIIAMEDQDVHGEGSDHRLDISEMFQRRASSNDLAETPRTMAVEAFEKPRVHNPAAFMIRSYSMPVATQRDFEAQQRAARSQRQQKSTLSFRPAWSMSRTNSSESTELPSVPMHSEREPLRTFESSEMNGTSLARTGSQFDATIRTKVDNQMAKNPFKWESANETPSPIESGSTSCSDETDVSTPRATSPFNRTSFFESSKQEESIHALSELQIHPDHLQPPPLSGF